VRTGKIFWRALIGSAVFAAILLGVLAYLATHYQPWIRDQLIATLEKRYQSKVEIQNLKVSVFPRPLVTGEHVELRLHGRTDVPPMVTVRRFTVHAGLWALLGRPIHIASVKLEGLQLTLPPKQDGESGAPAGKTTGTGDGFVVDEVNADGAFLRVLPKVAGKEPLEFDIARLTMHYVGAGQPMSFQASLSNPKPPGLIETTGRFGPWQSSEPGETPVDGHYTFSNADLSVFTGISGILSSTGEYQGRLNQIEVKGTTDIPDFRVSTSDHKVRLETTFQATVDGTNGDTFLHPVDARFLDTELMCNGKVAHRPGTPGKFIELQVATTKGRIDDLLKMALKGQPAVVGNASLTTDFLLPPGKGDVVSRLQLAGKFRVGSARFTSGKIEKVLTNLSLRAQGKPEEVHEAEEEALQITSDLGGNFTLGEGSVTLKDLAFSVPGAEVTLHGTYGIHSERIDFSGFFRMQAKVSQAFTGWKSVLLKVADPFFAKHGAGTEVPIQIGGTRENPSFGVELFHKQIGRKSR
jgi:hypothetical protein